MEKRLRILPPSMPNFVRFEQPPGNRQDGFKELPGMPITDFTKEEAEEYGELMKQEFIRHWQTKKANDEK